MQGGLPGEYNRHQDADHGFLNFEIFQKMIRFRQKRLFQIDFEGFCSRFPSEFDYLDEAIPAARLAEMAARALQLTFR